VGVGVIVGVEVVVVVVVPLLPPPHHHHYYSTTNVLLYYTATCSLPAARRGSAAPMPCPACSGGARWEAP